MAAINLGLRGDAATFAYTERVKNNGRDPIWEQFRLKFIEKYENHQVRGDLLRHKLRALRFYGPHRMTEYCEQYRHIESQIHDMAFLDRENQRQRRCFAYQELRLVTFGGYGSGIQSRKAIGGELPTNGMLQSSHLSTRFLKFGKSRPSGPSPRQLPPQLRQRMIRIRKTILISFNRNSSTRRISCR
jgi:hypothetical protein